jgi:hypothetical protein
MHRRSLVGLWLMLGIAGIAGCGGASPTVPEGVAVSGKVLLASGSPATGGLLVLRPEGGVHGASAKIGKDGTFTLADQSGRQTVVPGKYRAFLIINDNADKALRNQVGKRYQSTEDGDSDIIVDISVANPSLTIKFKS